MKTIVPYLPGLAVTIAIAGAAWLVHGVPALSTVSAALIAAVIGVVLAQTGRWPQTLGPGIDFSVKTLLRIAVALLGVQVTIGQVAAIGWSGFAILAAGLGVSFLTIKAAGRWLGVAPNLAELIAAGTSICGASAIAGVNAVTSAEDEDVAYAVAMVTLFGTAAMFGYPLLDKAFGLSAQTYGLWAGASIHEVAQVAGATAQAGPLAEASGAVAKLTRVAMLAPLVFGLKLTRRSEQARGPVVPWFVIAFVGLVALGSLIAIPAPVKMACAQISAFLLAMALAGMGLRTHIGRLAAKGWRPLALGAFGALFISILTFGLIKLFV